MDFHSLTRKELQSLCKLNKIPANITNVAMADALQSLDIVQGIEKFITVTQTETAKSDESKENLEVSPPKVPITRCRTTTRQKVKTTEPENLQPTDKRTTRRTAKKLTVGVEESKNDVLQTPALSSTRRKSLATSSCRNVNSQLNDCDLDAKEDDQKSVVTKSRRNVGIKTTSTTVKTYGTRRSTRQTEKKSGEPRVRKESEKAVEIILLLDEINLTSEEVLPVEDSESVVNEVNPNAEVEDICNAFEELEVKQDSCEVEISNPDEGKEEEMNDVKLEPDGISNPCENEDLEDENLESEVMDLEEQAVSVTDKIADMESDVTTGDDSVPDNAEDLKGQPDNDVFLDNTENSCESLKSVNENECNVDDENADDITEVSENMVDETSDVISAINALSPITEEVEVCSEKADDLEGCEKEQLSPNPTTLFDLIGHPAHVTPIRKTPATSCRKVNRQVNVSDQKSECNLSSPETDVASSRRKGVQSSASIKKEGTLQKAYSSRRSTRLTEKKSRVTQESEAVDKIDLMLDQVIEILTVEDPKNCKASEVKEDEGEFEVLRKLESFQSMNPCEDGDLEDMGVGEEVKPESDDVACETVDFVQEKLELVLEEQSESDDVIIENVKEARQFGEEGTLFTNSETNFHQVLENNGYSMMVNDMVLDNTEISKESLNMVDEKNFKDINEGSESMILVNNTQNPSDSNCENAEDDIKEGYQSMIFDNTENTNTEVDETLDVISFTENADTHFVEEKKKVSECGSILIDEVIIGGPTPMKKTTSSGIVCDNKENSAIVIGKKMNKEKGDNKYEDMSMRQLRKQFKAALTLKTISANSNQDASTARPALQALCENQLVGGETNN